MPTVYSSNGQFDRRVGSPGRGPGEFVRPDDVIFTIGDSAVVLDARGARATVFDAALGLARTVVLPFQLLGASVLSLPDSVVGSGSIQTASEFGWPLHRVSFRQRNAVAFKSFGSQDGATSPSNSMQAWFWTTPSQHYGFWSVWMYGYDLAEWTADGQLARLFQRRPIWFSTPSAPILGNPDTPPPPQVAAVQRTSDGLIWVFVKVPAPTWKQAWPKMQPGTREIPSQRISKELLFSTIVEVIDPTERRVIARQRIDRYVVGGLSAGSVAFYQVNRRSGEGELAIARITLDRR
jgi:hypothetical protein